jgi:riboflavin synthase
VFTGIVEERGEVTAVEHRPDQSARLTIRGGVVDGATPGDSMAVDGVCLTVVGVADREFTADVMRETLDRSSLGALKPGDAVNLERAATLQTRLGGHLVQGHVDATARLLDRAGADHWELVRFELPPGLRRYVVEKGSIAVDGVSLTVAALDGESFTVSLVPTTLQLTTLGRKQPGDPVNLEVDVIAKYVEKLIPGGVR